MALEHPLLARALASGRVGHAYAFVGPPGSGRRAAALEFARTLLGRDRPRHPDLHVIAPTPPDDNPRGARLIRIGAIRELERLASLRPLVGPWKVFLVEEAERMTSDAPQAFLKTLEEPPPGTVIILILARVGALPATVLSRCQIVRFRPAPSPAADAERQAARAALDDVGQQGIEAALRHAQSVDSDRPRAEALVSEIWCWYAELLRAKAGAPADGEAARVADSLTASHILAGLAGCREAWRALGVNVSPRLTLEVLLSRLAPGAC
jgi:DNA polymerase-3 subunit delta'